MKKIVASLSLATLLLGGTAVFANSTTHSQTPAAGATTPAKTAPVKRHRKSRGSHKPASNTMTPKTNK